MNNVKSRREASLRASGNVSTLLPDCLFVTSLLAQFQDVKVRTDYSSGLFLLPKRSSGVSLSELDLLWNLMNSSWLGFSKSMVKERMDHAMSQLVDLVIDSDRLFVLDLTSKVPIRSYSDWKLILQDLANSSYWRDVPKQFTLNLRAVDNVYNTVNACVNTDPVEIMHKSSNTVVTPFIDVGVSTMDVGIEKEETSMSDNCSIDLCGIESDSGFSSCNNLMSVRSSKERVAGLSDANSRGVLDICTKLPDKNRENTQLNVLPKTKQCSWCHKYGHLDALCWKKNRLCLICGGNHVLTNCPRYVVPPLPKCSICDGKHLGRFCNTIRKVHVFCHWCGRHGHTEDACWVKLGSCLICGSLEHQLLNCSRNIYRQSSLIPPQCMSCDLHHKNSGDCRDQM